MPVAPQGFPPTSIPEMRAEVLRLFEGKKTTVLTNPEMKERLAEKFHDSLTKVTSNLRTIGLLESNGFGRYSLSKAGLDLYKVLDQIPIIPHEQRKQSGSAPRKRSPAEPVQQELKINISNTANLLADNITALIDENAQYRKLMIHVYQTIGKAMGLNYSTEDKQ